MSALFDDMNKVKVGTLAVSRYHQLERYFPTDDVPNYPDHDFPVPGYHLIPSGYMRLTSSHSTQCDSMEECLLETSLNDYLEPPEYSHAVLDSEFTGPNLNSDSNMLGDTPACHDDTEPEEPVPSPPMDTSELSSSNSTSTSTCSQPKNPHPSDTSGSLHHNLPNVSQSTDSFVNIPINTSTGLRPSFKLHASVTLDPAGRVSAHASTEVPTHQLPMCSAEACVTNSQSMVVASASLVNFVSSSMHTQSSSSNPPPSSNLPDTADRSPVQSSSSISNRPSNNLPDTADRSPVQSFSSLSNRP